MAEASRRMRGHGDPPPPPPAAAERSVHAAPRHAAGSPAADRGQFRAVLGQVFIQLLYLHRHTHFINLGGGGHRTGTFAQWHLWLRLPLPSLKPSPPLLHAHLRAPRPHREEGARKKYALRSQAFFPHHRSPPQPPVSALSSPTAFLNSGAPPPLQQRGAPRPLRSPEAEGEEWAGAPGPGPWVGAGADHLPPPPCWPRAP